MNYKEMYLQLFNSITSALEEFEKSKVITAKIEMGKHILMEAQKSTENIYISKNEKG